MRGIWVRKVVPIAIILNVAAIGIWWRNRPRSTVVKQPALISAIPPAVPLAGSQSTSALSLNAIAQVDSWRWGLLAWCMVIAIELVAAARLFAADGPVWQGVIPVLYIIAGALVIGGYAAQRRWPKRTWPRWTRRFAGLLACAIIALAAAQMSLRSEESAVSSQQATPLWIAAVIGALVCAWPRHEVRTAPNIDPRPDRREVALLLVVLLIAILLRVTNLADVPYTLNGDESNYALQGRTYLEGVLFRPFVTVLDGSWGLFFLIMAAFMRGLGQTVETIRLASALFGALSVVALYALVRLLWNRRAAWLAAALLAASHLNIHFSRNAMSIIFDALYLPLVFGCVWLGWKTGRRRAWLMAGLALGLSQYFYIGSRVIPILLAVLGVFWLITERRRVQTQLLNIGLAAGVFATSVMPIAYWAVQHPNEYLTRFNATDIFRNGWFDLAMQTQRVGPIEILWNQLLDTVRVFVAGPDGLFYAGQALWSPLMSIVAVLSLFYLLRHWREGRSFFVLSSLGLILLVGGVFTMSPMVGAHHFVGTTPLIALTVAVLIDQGIRLANRRWPRPRVWATVGIAAVTGLMLADADYYFGRYIQAGTINTGDMEWAMKIGEYLHGIESSTPLGDYQIVCVSTEFSCDHSTVHFLAPRLGEHMQTVPGPIASLTIERPSNSHLILIIAGYLPDDIQAAEKRYPGAQRLDHVGVHNDLLFVSFEVAAEPSS